MSFLYYLLCSLIEHHWYVFQLLFTISNIRKHFFYASNHDLIKEASVYELVKEELHVRHLVVEMLTLLKNNETNGRGQAYTSLQI